VPAGCPEVRGQPPNESRILAENDSASKLSARSRRDP
jgi:hypothetical protein